MCAQPRPPEAGVPKEKVAEGAVADRGAPSHQHLDVSVTQQGTMGHDTLQTSKESTQSR
jgi:hypothetical protein